MKTRTAFSFIKCNIWAKGNKVAHQYRHKILSLIFKNLVFIGSSFLDLSLCIKEKFCLKANCLFLVATMSWGHLAELLSKVVNNWIKVNWDGAELCQPYECNLLQSSSLQSKGSLTDIYQCDLFHLFSVLYVILRSCKLTFTVFQNLSHVEGILSSYFTTVVRVCLCFYGSVIISIMIG